MRSMFPVYLVLFTMIVSLSSCEIVGGIFKAGMWTAVILIVIVVAVILWLFGRLRR